MLVYEAVCLYLRWQTGVNESDEPQSKQPEKGASRSCTRAGLRAIRKFGRSKLRGPRGSRARSEGRRVVNHEKDEVLQRYMAQHGLKSTRQRSLIIDTFFSVGGHLSVEELWNRVRQQDAKVSVATVYRTMKLLNECGLAHARNFGDGQTRYEAAAGRHHHDHLICTHCGTIVEFEDDRIEEMQDAVARKHGFTVTSHKMELYGLCRNCQRGSAAKSEA
jgi:Fur family transcriptional regulator, ferric uptake regulator